MICRSVASAGDGIIFSREGIATCRCHFGISADVALIESLISSTKDVEHRKRGAFRSFRGDSLSIPDKMVTCVESGYEIVDRMMTNFHSRVFQQPCSTWSLSLLLAHGLGPAARSAVFLRSSRNCRVSSLAVDSWESIEVPPRPYLSCPELVSGPVMEYTVTA